MCISRLGYSNKAQYVKKAFAIIRREVMAKVKYVGMTPKGGDVLEVLKYFEERAKTEGITLPEVEIKSTTLVEKFTRQVVNSMINVNYLRVD